ncbi:MAG: PorT family protein [Sphingobacteriaceae bacterium]|nr:MAG: PorT family protein [Sphingobacteriaceae bacterium]
MKKFLLVTCFVAISSLTFAQTVKFGIKAGPNFSKLHTSFPNESEINLSSDTYTSFNAGVFADIKLGKLSFQPAVNITGKGGKYNYIITDQFGTPAGTSYGTSSFTFLQVPLNLVYHIPVGASEVYFGAGPFFAFRIAHSGLDPDENTNDPYPFVKQVGSDEISTDAGINGIAGFKFKNGLLLNINYDLGMVDIGKNNGDNSLKTTVIGLSLGYVFK